MESTYTLYLKVKSVGYDPFLQHFVPVLKNPSALRAEGIEEMSWKHTVTILCNDYRVQSLWDKDNNQNCQKVHGTYNAGEIPI